MLLPFPALFEELVLAAWSTGAAQPRELAGEGAFQPVPDLGAELRFVGHLVRAHSGTVPYQALAR